MASEILTVPEENLAEVITVLRTGLQFAKVSTAVREQLTRWCDDEADYLVRDEENADE
jgi:hypothetical protein